MLYSPEAGGTGNGQFLCSSWSAKPRSANWGYQATRGRRRRNWRQRTQSTFEMSACGTSIRGIGTLHVFVARPSPATMRHASAAANRCCICFAAPASGSPGSTTSPAAKAFATASKPGGQRLHDAGSLRQRRLPGRSLADRRQTDRRWHTRQPCSRHAPLGNHGPAYFKRYRSSSGNTLPLTTAPISAAALARGSRQHLRQRRALHRPRAGSGHRLPQDAGQRTTQR